MVEKKTVFANDAYNREPSTDIIFVEPCDGEKPSVTYPNLISEALSDLHTNKKIKRFFDFD